ncbi:universal stress protein [Nocardioides sp.]|uniref:universal stress protein n=1 Tax=Nocardioides sp. TaxID=35761 RepID=UPI00198B0A0D|nr:universal stress protein [Nocardioides sp.]MBC7275769.1 universal stress protein [Nocardioides sp.]
MRIPEGAVLVGVENWPAAAASVSWAVEQAYRDGRDVCLIHVVSASSLDTPPGFRAGGASGPEQAHGAIVLSSAGRYAERRIDELSVAPGFAGRRRPAVSTEQRVGSAATALVDASGRASLLVLGSRGRGPLGSWTLGSVRRSVVKDARCPVVALCPGAGGVGRGVLVGIDGTSDSIPALEFAFDHAAQRGLPVTVLYCSQSRGPQSREDERLLVAECVAGLRERHPDLHPHMRITAGSLARELAEQAQTMHMAVVVGSSGGVARHLLDHAHSVVAVVPAVARRDDAVCL